MYAKLAWRACLLRTSCSLWPTSAPTKSCADMSSHFPRKLATKRCALCKSHTSGNSSYKLRTWVWLDQLCLSLMRMGILRKLILYLRNRNLTPGSKMTAPIRIFMKWPLPEELLPCPTPHQNCNIAELYSFFEFSISNMWTLSNSDTLTLTSLFHLRPSSLLN